MSKKSNHEKRQYIFDLSFDGDYAFFQDYSGPSMTRAEPGSRILTLKNGVAGIGALKNLVDWHDKTVRGQAATKTINVRDGSTFGKANSNMESADFFCATIVSLRYHGFTEDGTRNKIESMQLQYSHYQPSHD